MTKAITLHQPWATLIALGVKTIETRSWKPPAALIGERLLIHAGQRRPDGIDVGDFMVCGPKPHGFVDADAPWAVVDTRTDQGYPLPLGAIVASCIVADAVPMTDGTDTSHICEGLCTGERTLALAWPDPDSPIDVSDQRPYGDFAPGRWAWLLDDVRPTTERCPACWGTGDRPTSGGVDCMTCGGSGECGPIPAKGHQRVWEWAA